MYIHTVQYTHMCTWQGRAKKAERAERGDMTNIDSLGGLSALHLFYSSLAPQHDLLLGWGGGGDRFNNNKSETMETNKLQSK